MNLFNNKQGAEECDARKAL